MIVPQGTDFKSNKILNLINREIKEKSQMENLYLHIVTYVHI